MFCYAVIGFDLVLQYAYTASAAAQTDRPTIARLDCKCNDQETMCANAAWGIMEAY